MTSLRALLEKFTARIEHTGLLAYVSIGLLLFFVYAALAWLLEVVFGISLSLISTAILLTILIPFAMAISIIYRHKKSKPVDLRSRTGGLVIFFIGLGFIILMFSPYLGNLSKGGALIFLVALVAIPVGALMAIMGLYSNEN